MAGAAAHPRGRASGVGPVFRRRLPRRAGGAPRGQLSRQGTDRRAPEHQRPPGHAPRAHRLPGRSPVLPHAGSAGLHRQGQRRGAGLPGAGRSPFTERRRRGCQGRSHQDRDEQPSQEGAEDDRGALWLSSGRDGAARCGARNHPVAGRSERVAASRANRRRTGCRRETRNRDGARAGRARRQRREGAHRGDSRLVGPAQLGRARPAGAPARAVAGWHVHGA